MRIAVPTLAFVLAAGCALSLDLWVSIIVHLEQRIADGVSARLKSQGGKGGEDASAGYG